MNYSIFTDTIADMNWKELEEKSKKKVPMLFPLGVIEQHGPHLPLGSDIYFSYAICKQIKKALESRNMECLIVPPYYWGINHCTSAFPGTFSLKPETTKLVLLDIFENLHQFGFDEIYCVNEHGDSLHINTILQAIQSANITYQMQIKLLVEPYELEQFGLHGDENYILVDDADYPLEFFDDENSRKGLLDIHAGAFETASLLNFYPKIVDESTVLSLKDYSLSMSTINEWLTGGDSARKVVPLGYAGNPAGYKEKLTPTQKMFDILSKHVADKIFKLHSQAAL